MSKRTKKVGSAGRFQARYGVKSRTRMRNVELQQNAKHVCPSCGHKKVKRTDTGIWQCRKCGTKFAGGAYIPVTEVGEHVKKMFKGEIEALETIEEEDESENT
ncbi:MAG: 50S ribosomal protein L37ae [Candidatus Thermoplasmatota archaeon]|nr:50S ribosomal protein L37ae [Candidatus Thermoplasmatota archaeon]